MPAARSDCKKTPGWDPSFGITGPEAYPAYCIKHACEHTEDGELSLCTRPRSEANGYRGKLCAMHKKKADKAVKDEAASKVKEAKAQTKKKAQELKDMKKRSAQTAKNHRKEMQAEAAAAIEVKSANWGYTVDTPNDAIAAALASWPRGWQHSSTACRYSMLLLRTRVLGGYTRASTFFTRELGELARAKQRGVFWPGLTFDAVPVHVCCRCLLRPNVGVSSRIMFAPQSKSMRG